MGVSASGNVEVNPNAQQSMEGHFENPGREGVQSASEGEAGSDDFIAPPKVDLNAPPAYDVAVGSALPTYEEVERQKLVEFRAEGPLPNNRINLDEDDHWVHPLFHVDVDAPDQDSRLGTDFVFFAAFFAAFLLNWIGFLLLLCFCQTVAGRYGALAGFGLSLAKWTVIIKHSMLTHAAGSRFLIGKGGRLSDEMTTGAHDGTRIQADELDDDSWLWWLPLGFGMLICVHAIFQYIHIKRQWHIMSRSSRQRLLLFY
ncbi:unnamed protein product [Notodromas monacha]|uniref:Nedd4 family interacting protein 1 n=1 Tax=Notodromas monacha TaxID=399045 RepID=A0A7R9BHE2_9CRUS|nr:unnamed protein product [Notodromas monacha]CAG0913961.1 unnamed protein product [Notodromas monacha]